jgi:hypothetical protein
MRPEAKEKFFILLGEVMAGYGKLLDPATMEAWFKRLTPFEPATIRKAFDVYAAERPDFAPAPNGIAARCKLLDGRPEENEAWALALSSQDERETVVWTSEMTEAFGLCKPLLASGDEIGARMAFKDAYARLVADARAANRPPVWSVSEGWDGNRRQVAVERAARAGLLPAPPAHLMIESNLPPERPEGLKRVLAEMSKLQDTWAKAQQQRDARIEAEFHAEQQEKRELDKRVRDYEQGKTQHQGIGK